MSQNVRFVKTTKEKHLNRGTYDDNAIYFCQDTGEIYKGSCVYTHGVIMVPTKKDLPACPHAADGVVYFVEETKSGYMMSPDRTEWLQTIYAPVTDAYTIPEEEMYTTVTTVGAVRDIEKKLNDRIDKGVKTVNGEAPDKDGNITIKTGGVKTVNNIEPDEDGNVEIVIEGITYEELMAEFESVGILQRAMDDEDTVYTDNDGQPYLLRQSDLFNVVNSVNDTAPDNKGRVHIDIGVKTVNNNAPDENGNIDICKPFIGVGEEVEVVEGPLVFEFTKNTAFKSRYFEIDAEGKKYIVTFNGETYECISKRHVSADYIVYTIGNMNISDNGGEDTGEPFYYGFKQTIDGSAGSYGFVRVREHGNYVMSIIGTDIELVKIPENLIPEIVSPALKNVGKYLDIDGTTFSAEFTKNTAFKKRYLQIDDEGEIYKVLFNNVLYTCVSRKVVYDDYIAYILGNDDISDKGGQDTGEPFYYCFKKYTDGINSDYGLIRVREHGNYTVSIVKSTFVKISENLLPKIEVGVKTVNNETPDENGNIIVETGGIKTINSISPDEIGNLHLPDRVRSVNNEYPDDKGNVEICKELANVGNNVFVPIIPTYTYYKESHTDNGAPKPNFASGFDGVHGTVYLHFDGEIHEYDLTKLYIGSDNYVDSSTNTYYRGFGNFSLLSNDCEDTGESFVCYSYETYPVGASKDELIDSGFNVLFSDGKEHTYCVKVGRYVTNKIPGDLLPNRYGGIKTVNNQYPDENENVYVCKELANVGHQFVTTYPVYSYYPQYGQTNGAELIDTRNIKDDEIIKIVFDGQTYEFKGSECQSYLIDRYPDVDCVIGFGNFSIIRAHDAEGGYAPDTGEPFVFYTSETYDHSTISAKSMYYENYHITCPYSIAIGKYEFNKISQELLPETEPSVIVIECPDFNGQSSIPCETLGGYTISEMQEFINNGGIVRIKRTESWAGVSSIDAYYYEATSFVPIVNHDQLAIVFTASTVVPSGIIVTNEYSDNGELEVRCSDSFASDPNHQILVWAYDTLIDGYNNDTDKIVDVNSWADVQKIVRAGKASEMFSIGDQLVCNRNGEQLVWDIIGIDHDTPTDETKTHSLTLQLHDCFDGMKFNFDASEPTNPNADRARVGSNNWAESNIRQWLNSNKSANNWFEPQTEYDTAPKYANVDGFLYGMDADFVSVIGEVSKTTMLNEVTDGGSVVDSTEKIFLLSMTEVYCGGDEGTPYEYYTSASSVGQPNSAADDARIKYSNGVATAWWLRTANTHTSGKVRPVNTDGSIMWTDAYLNTHGVAPACCII